MEKLIETLATMGRAKIVLLGDFMLDEYVYGDIERISPEAPVPVLRVVRREMRCGGAANTALAMAALGAEVQCVGVIGKDAAGEELIGLLTAAGCETSGLLPLGDRPTILKRRYVGLAQHRHAQQVLRVDEESTDGLGPDIAIRLGKAVAKRLAVADLLAVEDYNKGVVEASGPQAIEKARAATLPVVCDPACVASYDRYRGATLITPNRFEASLASGIEIDSEVSMGQAATTLIEQFDIANVAITLDKQGAWLQSAGQTGQRIPTRPRSVYDVTGAGDVVMAMLALALAEKVDLPLAVALANLAGGLEVERFGVVPVTRDEIRDEIEHELGQRRSKVLDRTQLSADLQRRRTAGGETIVFTNGCFDMLHMGHVNYLQQARELGTCLVVAINSDDSIRRLKGPSRPIIPAEERANMLAALECIDYVTIFDEDTPEALLERLCPDLLVKGGSTDVIVGAEIVEGYGGAVRRLDLVEGRSTTDIINDILDRHNGD